MYEIRTSRFCVSQFRDSRDTDRSRMFRAALWFRLSHTAVDSISTTRRCDPSQTVSTEKHHPLCGNLISSDALIVDAYRYYHQICKIGRSNSTHIAAISEHCKFPKFGLLPLCEVRSHILIAILYDLFSIAGSSIVIVLTASIPTLLPFTAALPSSRFLLHRRKTGKVDVTSDWSDATRPGWLHCFRSGSWLPTQLITAPVGQVCAASQSVEGISRLPFRSVFAPIGRTPRVLRLVSAASALKPFFVILIFAHKKKNTEPPKPHRQRQLRRQHRLSHLYPKKLQQLQLHIIEQRVRRHGAAPVPRCHHRLSSPRSGQGRVREQHSADVSEIRHRSEFAQACNDRGLHV